MSYFTIEELTKSETAKALDIDNTPPEDVKRNLEELIDILNGIREGWTILCKEKGWGKASIIVGSGYRCPKLNAAIKGSKKSAHMLGYAADIEPSNQKNLEFYNYVKDYLLGSNIPFDQLINEKPKCGIPSWIHLGLYNSKGQQRKQIFTLI